MFYNRPDLLNIIVHRINSFSEGYRQNIAIIGEPCSGKTTLIKEILSSDKLKKDSIEGKSTGYLIPEGKYRTIFEQVNAAAFLTIFEFKPICFSRQYILQ